MNSIHNKVVVITGASSGLGEATARLLASKGARLELAARRLERLQQLAADIIQAGGQAIAIGCDVAQEAAVAAAVEQSVATFGGLDFAFTARASNPH